MHYRKETERLTSDLKSNTEQLRHHCFSKATFLWKEQFITHLKVPILCQILSSMQQNMFDLLGTEIRPNNIRKAFSSQSKPSWKRSQHSLPDWQLKSAGQNDDRQTVFCYSSAWSKELKVKAEFEGLRLRAKSSLWKIQMVAQSSRIHEFQRTDRYPRAYKVGNDADSARNMDYSSLHLTKIEKSTYFRTWRGQMWTKYRMVQVNAST